MTQRYTEGYEDGRVAEDASRGDVRALQWKQLEAALFSLTNAQFEYERAVYEPSLVAARKGSDAGRTHVEDCRRALGTLALTLADGPDAEGYARLFQAINTPPQSEGGE